MQTSNFLMNGRFSFGSFGSFGSVFSFGSSQVASLPVAPADVFEPLPLSLTVVDAFATLPLSQLLVQTPLPKFISIILSKEARAIASEEIPVI